MLSEFFVDELTLQVLRNAVFQQDGAPAHFSRPVREFLDETFPGHWIGRGGSVEWPPYSPDLTPCDFWLWGMLKDQVYSAPLRTIEELKERISVVIQNIPASMCSRVINSTFERFDMCIENNGVQVESL
jgi:hypothetical protein